MPPFVESFYAWDVGDYHCPKCKHTWHACVPPSWESVDCPNCGHTRESAHVSDSVLKTRERKAARAAAHSAIDEVADDWA